MPSLRVRVRVLAPDSLAVVQATLAPAFVLTGGGIFLNFVQARLFRVTDRLRALKRERRTADDALQDVLDKEIAIALGRGNTLRNAIVFGVLALGLVVLTMILILVGAMVPQPAPRAVVFVPFGFAMASLAVAFGLGAGDTLLSYRALKAELAEP